MDIEGKGISKILASDVWHERYAGMENFDRQGRYLTEEDNKTLTLISKAHSFFSQTDGMTESFHNTYIIEKEIGSGSGGIVFKAYHKRLKKYVVLKKMKVAHQNIQENRREADILKQLRHSYLPGVIDFIDISGEIFTVMDYIEGDTVANWLQKGRKFTQEESIKYGYQLLEALIYLHGQSIPVLHGDIKPANIMLTPEGNICLIDFNISGYLLSEGVPVSGFTPGYAAPEQEFAIREAMQSGRPVRTDIIDARADIYSAGAVIFTLLTGRMPDKVWDINKVVLKTKGVSNNIIHVLKKALSINPAERYSSAAEMLENLKSRKYPDEKHRKKRLLQTVIISALSVIILGTAIYLVMNYQNKKSEQVKLYQLALSSIELAADEISGRMEGMDIGEAKIILKDAQTEAQENYDYCMTVYPNRAAPITAMARFLYESGQYNECRHFIKKNVVQAMADSADKEESTEYGKLYYLLGNCYNLEEKYDEAARAFALALEKDGTNSDYYRVYAACLVKSGQSMKAEEILKEAVDKGMDESQILMLRGNILLKQKRYEEAAAVFEDCIKKEDNKEYLLQDYLNAAEAYRQMGATKENAEKAAGLLEEARTAVDSDNNLPVLEAMVQTYITLYDMTEDASYANKGVSASLEIIRGGWSTALTYDNIVILLQKTGKLNASKSYVEEMLSKYPEDYRSYKRAAFTEIALQAEKDIKNRNYTAFEDYYQKMTARLADGNSETEDAEVGKLKDIYGQLDEEGWFAKYDFPEGSMLYNGHHYYIYNGDAANWDEVMANCRMRGGYPAVVNDSEENERLFQFMKDEDLDTAFIGLTLVDGKWKYLEGDTSDFRDWGVNLRGKVQPNNSGGNERNVALDIYMLDGHWNDVLFGRTDAYVANGSKYKNLFAYICEWDR